MNILYARLYITTEDIYASGNLFGSWMNLSKYNNVKEFYAAFKQLYNRDCKPVLKLLDWQNIPNCLIQKNNVSPRIFKIIKSLSDFDDYHNEAFCIWLEWQATKLHRYTTSELISQFMSSYLGYFRDQNDFGKYYAREFLAINNPKFNYEKYTEQLFETRFFYQEGYVFEK